jgi:hypothetical protein
MFRFTIREVLWLTVVVALVSCWFLDHNRLVNTAAHWESKAVFLANSLLGTEHQVGEPWELEDRLKLLRRNESLSSR